MFGRCWTPPMGSAEMAFGRIDLDFEVAKGGALEGSPIVTIRNQTPLNGHLAGSVTRTLRNCAPYALRSGGSGEAAERFRAEISTFDDMRDPEIDRALPTSSARPAEANAESPITSEAAFTAAIDRLSGECIDQFVRLNPRLTNAELGRHSFRGGVESWMRLARFLPDAKQLSAASPSVRAEFRTIQLQIFQCVPDF